MVEFFAAAEHNTQTQAHVAAHHRGGGGGVVLLAVAIACSVFDKESAEPLAVTFGGFEKNEETKSFVAIVVLTNKSPKTARILANTSRDSIPRGLCRHANRGIYNDVEGVLNLPLSIFGD